MAAPVHFRLELVTVPVSDVDRAKAFDVDQAGFSADGNEWSVHGPARPS